uniref:Prokineticin-1 n=5 Tax=Neoaves TaxID=3078114 RepID=A0A8C0AZ44_9AVES
MANTAWGAKWDLLDAPGAPFSSSQHPQGLPGVVVSWHSICIWASVSPSRWGEACERDPQCGSGTCCAVSLWLRGLRMCTPLGQEGDECHPFSHKVPFFGKRQHHTCPCLPNFICSRFLDGRYRCSIDFKNIDF